MPTKDQVPKPAVGPKTFGSPTIAPKPAPAKGFATPNLNPKPIVKEDSLPDQINRIIGKIGALPKTDANILAIGKLNGALRCLETAVPPIAAKEK